MPCAAGRYVDKGPGPARAWPRIRQTIKKRPGAQGARQRKKKPGAQGARQRKKKPGAQGAVARAFESLFTCALLVIMLICRWFLIKDQEMKNGIIYRGPSLYDGAPIVVIASYTTGNRKTGGVVQTYILREDVDPRLASKNGADASICGTCPHRGAVTTDPARKIAKGRTCYVNLGQGVLITWRAFHRGVYPDAQRERFRAAIGAGRVVRLGTYGDPAAVPDHVWTDLLRDAASHTAYTHASEWRPDLAMQSADTYLQARAAWAKGHRTFRVVQGVVDIDLENEVLCPASKEAGARTTCAACKLCGGTATRSSKSIAIPMH